MAPKTNAARGEAAALGQIVVHGKAIDARVNITRAADLQVFWLVQHHRVRPALAMTVAELAFAGVPR